MPYLNTNVNIKIKTLSPIHVGAGSTKWLKYGIDWLELDEHIYLLNSEAIFLDMDAQSQNAYINAVAKNELTKVADLIQDRFDIKDSRYHTSKSPYSRSELKDDIQPLIRTGMGEPYLPATSIKGAMASAIFRFLFMTKGLSAREFNKHTQSDLMGNFKNSIMRFIRPSDVVLTETEYNNIILFNLYSDKQNSNEWFSDYKMDRSKTFNISIEHFKTGIEGQMRLSLATGLADFIRKNASAELPLNYDLVLKGNPIDALFAIINQHTLAHLRREIAFFKKYDQADDVDMVIEQLESYEDKIASYGDNKTCILRMSSGIGFHGITGDWRFEDHTSTILKPDEQNKTWSQTQRAVVPSRYKSRKLIDAEDLQAMGFIELRQG